ncbi:DUF2057 domain-containing protein [Pontibacterium granulatum]|uniref:YccT family protein n=1 Tax=Pontibacterium granulatum TaxID=2036029 RepID=UPI00249CEC33|nr:DUF2057 domain-containing protein [Pontibacterium granulatum]MDI3326887.1 DUF2057 domain-containing protein [Pontibacterium granulatum]
MKKTVYSLLVSLCAISTPVLADVTVQLEEGISVLAINGKEVIGKSVFSGADMVKLNDGINQLLVQYTAEIKTSADEYELESTDPFVLLLDAANEQLVLKAPAIKSEKDIAQFNKQGSWRLINRDGTLVALKSAVLKKEGFQLARNYEYELSEFNMSGAEAALPYKQAVSDMAAPASVPVIHQADLNKISNSNQASEVNMAEQMLRYWYNQSDAETRKRFKKWINQ